jgi:hypothetical protein
MHTGLSDSQISSKATWPLQRTCALGGESSDGADERLTCHTA